MNQDYVNLSFGELLKRVTAILPEDTPVYLVGGAVRDAMLSIPTHDLDFTLSHDALRIARQVANALGGAYYPLDPERETGRVILSDSQGNRLALDFAAFRGLDLEGDLRDRDFTINAMAIEIHNPNILIDPLGGAGDLRQKLLRSCSRQAFKNDPVRILRSIRQAVALDLHILSTTQELMRQAIPDLERVSPERLRDEFFRILDDPKAATALRTMDILGVLDKLLPELTDLKGVTQSPPHINDVWTHTLDTIQKLYAVLNVLAPLHDPDKEANWTMGLISLRLGRYRKQLSRHMAQTVNPDRSLKSLLMMAGLYHDIGKPASLHVEEGGRRRFFGHEQIGAEIAGQRADWLRLSRAEIARLQIVIRHHLRPLLLAQIGAIPSRRAIYRFFRDTGPAGVDICFLSLADTLATHGPGLDHDVWAWQVDIVRALLEAWWEKPAESVSPPTLLTGSDLIEEFKMKPGPRIGELLAALREAQAIGEIQDREQALLFTRAWLDNNQG
jgi:putative nucleotidyltransferase with HDIG domain